MERHPRRRWFLALICGCIAALLVGLVLHADSPLHASGAAASPQLNTSDALSPSGDGTPDDAIVYLPLVGAGRTGSNPTPVPTAVPTRQPTPVPTETSPAGACQLLDTGSGNGTTSTCQNASTLEVEQDGGAFDVIRSHAPLTARTYAIDAEVSATELNTQYEILHAFLVSPDPEAADSTGWSILLDPFRERAAMRVYRVSGNTWVVDQELEFPSAQFSPGALPNHIRVERTGEIVRAFLNGVELMGVLPLFPGMGDVEWGVIVSNKVVQGNSTTVTFADMKLEVQP